MSGRTYQTALSHGDGRKIINMTNTQDSIDETQKLLAVFLLGLPGTGKTYYRRLYEGKGYKIVSADDIIEAQHPRSKKGYDKFYARNYHPATKAALKLVDKYIFNNQSFIVDMHLPSVSFRKPLLDKIPGVLYTKVGIEFSVNDELLYYNNRSKQGKQFKEFRLRALKENYQPPKLEEGFDILDRVYDYE